MCQFHGVQTNRVWKQRLLIHFVLTLWIFFPLQSPHLSWMDLVVSLLGAVVVPEQSLPLGSPRMVKTEEFPMC